MKPILLILLPLTLLASDPTPIQVTVGVIVGLAISLIAIGMMIVGAIGATTQAICRRLS